MAISAQQDRNVTDTFQGFEANDFSVDVNEKTFRVLLDTLYTNKVRATIRELWTNAFDSHIMAGCAAKSFRCQLPNAKTPTFMVRDYGVSLTHEQVMVLYTTVFRSTKERTNAQVGQLGLGSKSPFCYTDAFSVVAYMDGEKRTYLAHIQGCTCTPVDGAHEARCKAGVPTIKHLNTEPTSEPQGLEVSFPVQQVHFQEFAQEAMFVARGFDTPPKVEGADYFSVPEPKFAHNNWKIFAGGQRVNNYTRNSQQNTGGMPNAVRQGCVIYPLTDNQLQVNTGLSYEYTLVVDVPIGTVEHTANREALSLDDKTKAAVIQAFNDATRDITSYVEAKIEKESKTIIEAEKAYFHWQRMFSGGRKAMKWKGEELKGYIAWDVNDPRTPTKILDYKEKTLEPWKDHAVQGAKPSAHHWSIQVITADGNGYEPPIFIFDSGDRTVPRRRLRYREWRSGKWGKWGGSHVWIIVGATKEQRQYVQDSLELKPSQMINVEDLPDPGPPVRNATAPPQERSGVYEVQGSSMRRLVAGDKIPDEYIWCAITKQQPSEYVSIAHIGSGTQERIGHELNHFFIDSGTRLPFLMLTERAVKRLTPKPEYNLGEWMNDTVTKNTAKMFLRVKSQFIANLIRQGAVPGLNIPSQESAELWNLMTTGLGFDFTTLLPSNGTPGQYVKSPGRYAMKLLTESEIQRAEKAASAYFEILQKKYPLLFGNADTAFLKSYIQQKGTTNKP